MYIVKGGAVCKLEHIHVGNIPNSEAHSPLWTITELPKSKTPIYFLLFFVIIHNGVLDCSEVFEMAYLVSPRVQQTLNSAGFCSVQRCQVTWRYGRNRDLTRIGTRVEEVTKSGTCGLQSTRPGISFLSAGPGR